MQQLTMRSSLVVAPEMSDDSLDPTSLLLPLSIVATPLGLGTNVASTVPASSVEVMRGRRDMAFPLSERV